jgi:hypothetical protein
MRQKLSQDERAERKRMRDAEALERNTAYPSAYLSNWSSSATASLEPGVRAHMRLSLRDDQGNTIVDHVSLADIQALSEFIGALCRRLDSLIRDANAAIGGCAVTEELEPTPEVKK